MRKFAAFLVFAAVLAGLPGLLMGRALAQTYRVTVTGTFNSGGTLSGSFLVNAAPANVVDGGTLSGFGTATGYKDAAISMLSITADGQTFTNANISDTSVGGTSAAVYFSQPLSNGATPLILMGLISPPTFFHIGILSCCPDQYMGRLDFLNTGSGFVASGTYSATVSAFLVPFGPFNAKLEIELGEKPKHDSFELKSEFTLGNGSNGINPAMEPVILQIGAYTARFKTGDFKGKGFGPFEFEGVIDNVRLEAHIRPTGANRYAFDAEGHGANLMGTKKQVAVILTIGDDSGMTSVRAGTDRER